MEKAFLKFTAQFYNMHYSNSCLPCPGVPFLRAYATLLARNSDDLTSLSLTEASARIRAGAITSTQLITTCLSRIDTLADPAQFARWKMPRAF